MSYDTLPSRTMRFKPDFDECIARIYAWYDHIVIDRVPVRFHHHNIEYERCRVVEGSWKSTEDRWLDVDFQVNTFVKSLGGAEFFGETFPVFWPNLSAVVYDHFDRILKKHDQLSVTWMNLPSFETFNVLACDFAVNISPDHFDEFCMPILRKEAETFTHNVFHMDGAGVGKNIDSILTLPNLAGVQWVQGYGKDKPIMQWIPLVEKIQAAGKSVIVDLELDELDEFMSNVGPAGIMLWIPAGPKDQQDVLKRVKGW